MTNGGLSSHSVEWKISISDSPLIGEHDFSRLHAFEEFQSGVGGARIYPIGLVKSPQDWCGGNCENALSSEQAPKVSDEKARILCNHTWHASPSYMLRKNMRRHECLKGAECCHICSPMQRSDRSASHSTSLMEQRAPH